MNEITIIAFNYGNAGKYINGPGMCLVNFVKKLKSLNVKVNIFSEQKSNILNVKSLMDDSICSCIKRSSYLHHWSGMGNLYVKHIKFAENNKIPVIIGPNVLDTVNEGAEHRFLSQVKPKLYVTLNDKLRYSLSKIHSIPIEKIDLLLVGPDEEIWAPNEERNRKILWKGNSKHFVKDIGFGIKVANKLSNYKFEFIGYPEPYQYEQHIKLAKSCYMYYTTSLSETMGLSILESACSGLPVIMHPKIYLNVQNYKIGITTNRDVNNYCDAITEVMENDSLYSKLSLGGIDYVKNEFSQSINLFINNNIMV
jgi:glycosyltransferase involved in cell wall biosynthesis